MQCPECKSDIIRKNGKNKQKKQMYICVECNRQFISDYEPQRGYSDRFKRECLKMYVNGMGFRALKDQLRVTIERVKGVHHTTIITWVKKVGKLLPDAYEPDEKPQVGELDELETFVGKKKTKFGSGQQLTTLSQEFQAGHWEIAAQKRLNHCGILFKSGNATFT